MPKTPYIFHFVMTGRIRIEAETVDEAQAVFDKLTKDALAAHPDTELEADEPVEEVTE